MKAKYIFCVLIASMITACTTEDPRYRDLRNLERPPTLATTKTPSSETRLSDDGALDRESGKKGLGEVVYLTNETPPHQLKIKQSLDQAWNALERALKQSDIEVTDHERDKGLYYIAYKPAGFFSKLARGSMPGHNEANYTLTLEQDGNEIVVIPAAIGSAAGNQKDDNETADTTEALLQTLYNTLHDDLKAE
jgi:uncharacterized lipoprotein